MSEAEVARPSLVVTPAAGAAEIEAVRRLFREYAEWLRVDLCFQGFEAELRGLPGVYAPPRGGLWLARDFRRAGEDGIAGCVALRPFEADKAEIKRLWVRPALRGQGLGRRLAETSLAAARAAGYRRACLDTLAQMVAARALYGALGFKEIPGYYDDPRSGLTYLELNLIASPVAAR